MDESWRMQMGMSSFRARRSTGDFSQHPVLPSFDALDPQDFSDVFGGPPRSILSRQFCEGYGAEDSNSFYEEIFQSRESVTPGKKSGRSLPAFRIPARSEGFYSDIFGSGDERRSRERSGQNSKRKSNSSSVLSSEEVSPLWPGNGEDVALSSFAAKLRPINVRSRWNSAKMMAEGHEKKQEVPNFSTIRSAYLENQCMEDEFRGNLRGLYSGAFPRPISSPETISLEPNSMRSIKVSVDDLVNSPSSAVSSIYQEAEIKAFNVGNNLSQEEDDDDDEVMSSYVIEITSEIREGSNEAVAIEEVIAWAKETSQNQRSNMRQHGNENSAEPEGRPKGCEFSEQQSNAYGHAQLLEVERQNRAVEEGNLNSAIEVELEVLDKDIRLWSAGKETNIGLLLSNLHHILWPSSGWVAIPLTGLVESSQVKKAYQRARLCLHPDKLQQRGATAQQKHIAKRVFSILQDAWIAFVSQDAFL